MDMRWSRLAATDTVVAIMKSSAACVFFSVMLGLLGGVACGTSNDDSGSPPGDGGGASSDGGSSPTTSDVVRVCMLNNACGNQSPLGLAADTCVESVLKARLYGHVTEAPEQTHRYERMFECARTAKTCSEYLACTRFGGTCEGTVAGSCQGTIAYACSSPGRSEQPPIFDCALVGATCEPSGSGGVCVQPASAPACTSDARCDGNTRVVCRPKAGGGTGELRSDCPAGTTCLSDGRAAACLAESKPCAALGSQCEGDTAVLCAGQGDSLSEVRSGCAAVGRKCALDEKNVARCVPIASDCTAATGYANTTRCDGTTLEVCIEGRVERLDCASVGMTSCTVSPGIPSVRPDTATCQ